MLRHIQRRMPGPEFRGLLGRPEIVDYAPPSIIGEHGRLRPCLPLLLALLGCQQGPQNSERTWPLMGGELRAHVWAADSAVTNRALQAAHDEAVLVDNLMSSAQDNSEVSVVNRRAGKDSITYISPSLTSVIATAIKYSRET